MLSTMNAKLVAISALGGGSFVLGVLPLTLHSRHHRWPLLMSALLCFGAGVLLATAIIHMLPEVRESLAELAEPVFCAGFFLLYFIDEVVHFMWTSDLDNSQATQASACCTTENANYGSTGIETARECTHNNASPTSSLLCHTKFNEPCPNSSTSRIGLLVALTIHSTLEGMAIGLQGTSSEVMLLVGAVACHKLVVAVCLGVELAGTAGPRWKHVLQIALFAGGCSAGIGIGMGIDQIEDNWTKLAIPLLQAIAGGTLLYVTVCEVLPRERARWHHQTTRKAAGMVQFLSVILGFGLMLCLNVFVEEHEEANPVP